jgi:hypothetical protein
MPKSQSDSSQFRQDLDNPQAGLNSDLYQAISPMISSDSHESLRGAEASKINSLKEQVRKGLVGLEYMTGNKKNTGETFYDEHPVQALATDVLGKSPLIGAGLAGGGMLLNNLRQKRNLDKTMPASMARMGNNPEMDASHPGALLNPREGDVRGDIARLYGEPDSAARMQLTDRLSDVPHTDPTSLTERHRAAKRALGDLETAHASKFNALNSQMQSAADDKAAAKIQKQIASLEAIHAKDKEKLTKDFGKVQSAATAAKGRSHLEKNVNFHESLRRAKEQGGFAAPVGSGLDLPEFLRGIAPDKHQAIVDLAERLQTTKAHPGFDQALMLRSVEDFLEDPKKFEEFKKHSLPKLTDKQHQGSGIRRLLSRNKTPLAIGAAAGVGGTGLYYLVKALQNKMYSKDKTNEWKKTLLKSRGDFDTANQIQ